MPVVTVQSPRIIPYLNASMDSLHCQLYQSPVRHIVSSPPVTCFHTMTFSLVIFQNVLSAHCLSFQALQTWCRSIVTGPLPSSQQSPFSWINLLKESTVSELICCACYAALMHHLHFWENAKWDYCLTLDGHKPHAAGSPLQERRMHRALW